MLHKMQPSPRQRCNIDKTWMLDVADVGEGPSDEVIAISHATYEKWAAKTLTQLTVF